MKIQEVVRETVAFMLELGRQPKDFYKATEQRLYALPTLMANVERYKLDIADLKREGVTSKSKDITSWGGAGVRITEEEKQQARIMLVEHKLARDSAEVETLEDCLARLAADDALFIRQVYMQCLGCNVLDIPPTTFNRRRGRLVRQISVMLYGADAVK